MPPSHRESWVIGPEADQGLCRAGVKLAGVAAEQAGVVDSRDLRACGLSADAVAGRARNGLLHRVHRGVYAVGYPALSLTGRFVAAAKACDAPLSHRASAAYWEMLEWREQDIEVTVPAAVSRAHPGIRVHRSSLLTRRDVMFRRGMFVTAPGWTLVALAAVLDAKELRRAASQALALKLVSVRQILDLIDRVGPLRGTRKLAEILAQGATPTRTELEDVVLDLIVRGGFVPPDVNRALVIGGRTVIPDFRWPEQRLVVEADSARWHDSKLAREDDAERQALLEAQGERVLRVRWNQAVARPAQTRARIAAAGAPFRAERSFSRRQGG